ncbi:aldehyde dehydrogenase family protein [Streptomyces sp. AJS327]|nr:aldehyde dehydrogenase family protein [Streptomyces sp. AJS327]
MWSVDPRTGRRREQVTVETTAEGVDTAVHAAHATRDALRDRATRAGLLRAAAGELEADRAELVAVADAETALGETRLHGELTRAAGQFTAFAEEVEEGGYLEATIDHADPGLTPPRPDLRRYRVPLGVVAVYAASNFPFAFSVPGGDTASALAAGCPVVIKAHPAHPATARRCAAALRRAAARSGLPEDTVVLIHGFDAGAELVRHPLVAAAGFTGSVGGGRALHDAAAARPVPIPFHGELGSLNPVVVTEAAAREGAEEIGAGLAGSVSLGAGQFCVKPGLVLVPEGEPGRRLETAFAAALREVPPAPLLDERTRAAFLAGIEARARLDGVTAPLAGGAREAERAVAAGYLTVPAARLAEAGTDAAPGGPGPLFEECFGPVTVLVSYRDTAELTAVLELLPGSLTATVRLGAREAAGHDPAGAELLAQLAPLAGRLLADGWPTGVAVTRAQHHGGPYPAATSTATSVGAAAIDRWLRPVVYQSTPEPLLPPELRDGNPLGLPRRVDGRREPAPSAN